MRTHIEIGATQIDRLILHSGHRFELDRRVLLFGTSYAAFTNRRSSRLARADFGN